MKHKLLLLFLTIALNSCYIMDIGKSPEWRSYGNRDFSKINNDTLKHDIHLEPKLSFSIPIPFLLIFFNSKKYSFSNQVVIKKSQIRHLDSLNYRLRTKDNIEIDNGVIKVSNGEFKWDKNLILYSTAGVRINSEKKIKIAKNFKQENLFFEGIYFFRDFQDKQLVLKDTFELNIRKRPLIEMDRMY